MKAGYYLYNGKYFIMDSKSTKMKSVELLQEHLREEDYKEIDSRRERHLNGESKSYSLDEVKQKVQKDSNFT